MISGVKFLEDIKELLSITEDVDMNTDLLDIDEWSSLSAMSFIAMVEEKYNVKLEPYSVAEAILIEDLYNVVKMEVE